MATTRKPGADDQNQDATASTTQDQAQNHAQTPDQGAANRGAYAQSSYQNTQAGAHTASSQPQGSQQNQDGAEEGAGTNKLLDTALQAGKKWLTDSGVLDNANQLPQVAKEWGAKALNRVSGLSNTQKAVGGALLLAGVAYLTTRGKGKSSYAAASHDDDSDYRSGSSYRQGGWAGYAGGKSASRRNAESGSRSEVSSYGTERRASSGSGYGRSASSSTDTDFGSGRESSASPYANRRGADSSSNYSAGSGSQYGSSRATGSSSGSGSYSSGSRYEAGRSSPSATSGQTGRSSYGSTPNSNEQDYDA